MWTNAEFIDKYLRPNQLADRWEKFVYPAMKEAIICSMLVAQDAIDTRKVTRSTLLDSVRNLLPSFVEFVRTVRGGFHAGRGSETVADRNQLQSDHGSQHSGDSGHVRRGSRRHVQR